jgi:hypothetical protein
MALKHISDRCKPNFSMCIQESLPVGAERNIDYGLHVKRSGMPLFLGQRHKGMYYRYHLWYGPPCPPQCQRKLQRRALPRAVLRLALTTQFPSSSSCFFPARCFHTGAWCSSSSERELSDSVSAEAAAAYRYKAKRADGVNMLCRRSYGRRAKTKPVV